MAIEFDCPYCTATIRVPDSFGGQQGRCPKCNTRLLVPVVVRPGSTTVPAASAHPLTDHQHAATPGAMQNAAPVQTPVPTSAEVPTVSGIDPFSVKPVGPVNINRRRRARRRPSRALVIGMPVLCFLVLLAVIFFSVTKTLPLTGELTARRLEERQLPPVTIPWSECELAETDLVTLQEFLTTNPETLASELMTCRMLATPEGLEIRLTAGQGNNWFAVSPTTSKSLALWLKKERPALNRTRLEVRQNALQAWCRDKLLQISGERITIDAITVRDHVCLNACGDALSFAVHAVVGTRAVPCAYEDDTGSLYFCLPRMTQSFQIQGRNLPNGVKVFAGEYNAVVATSSRPAVNDVSTQPDPAMKSPDGSQGASDKSGTMDVPEPDSMSDETMSDEVMSDEVMSDDVMSDESMSSGAMSKQ